MVTDVSPGGDRPSAYDAIHSQALVEIEQRKLHPVGDLDRIRDVVAACVDDYQRRAYSSPGWPALRDPSDTLASIVRAVTEFGALTELLVRPDVQDIFIEGARVDYKDESGRLQGLVAPTTLAENRRVIDQLLSATNRRLDASTPIVQARVLGGTARLTALIDPVADGLCAHIRRYTLRKQTLRSLVERGSLPANAAGFLHAVMQGPTPRIVVSGRMGAGKTSLLSALLTAAPAQRVVRCCETVRELHVPLPHASFWEAQDDGLTGAGGVSLRRLGETALAMAADMIVIGEVRGAEAYELAQAMNAGSGFAVSVHSNTARDALGALVFNATKAGEGVPEASLRTRLAESIDYVVHLDMDDVSRKATNEPVLRQVMEIIAVLPSAADGTFTTEAIFQRDDLGQPLRWTGYIPTGAGLLERALPQSVTLQSILEGRAVAL